MKPAPDTDRTASFQDILAQAAGAAEVDLDAFMHAAWTAYVDARPGLRQHLEEMKLHLQLEALREQGQMPQA
ncbi:MAG: hypothetical protein HS111_35530 [Kofleriaceae bacterium]|nr:hypothetical protein [Kofleriaceae bacterium]MCL4224477.1 hypothetical protein [Myxococcales bacterium]